MNRAFSVVSVSVLVLSSFAAGCYVRTYPACRGRDDLSYLTATGSDPRVSAGCAGLRLLLGRRLLGLEWLRLELEQRLLERSTRRLRVHRAALRLGRRAHGLLPQLLAGPERLS